MPTHEPFAAVPARRITPRFEARSAEHGDDAWLAAPAPAEAHKCEIELRRDCVL
jgi:hypothetical protein